MHRLNVLVTAGPTRESIDPVRFLSNRSSGKMGFALAEAAVDGGHRVTLVSGPVALKPPRGLLFHPVETAAEMHVAVVKAAKKADLVIMAAAVSDYQPARTAPQKIKKSKETLILRLKKTPDILAELGRSKRKGQFLVGFAAETDRLLDHAKEKLNGKNLDLIVANRVGVQGTGFEADHNRVTLLYPDGQKRHLPRMTKQQLARRLLRLILLRKASAPSND